VHVHHVIGANWGDCVANAHSVFEPGLVHGQFLALDGHVKGFRLGPNALGHPGHTIGHQVAKAFSIGNQGHRMYQGLGIAPGKI